MQYDFKSLTSGLQRGDFDSLEECQRAGGVVGTLEDLKRDELTLIIVTHEIGFARRAADRVVVLAEGKIVEDGPPGQVLDDPQTARTQQFLSQMLI